MDRSQRDRQEHESSPVSEAGERVPGRQTLTERLPTAQIARDGEAPPPDKVPEPVVNAVKSEAGSPLADADRWSDRVGANVGHAKVVEGHAAADAAGSIDARAFTVGDRAFFGEGQGPGTDGGDLLAHELIHVAQQGGADVPDPSNLAFTQPGGALEADARAGSAGAASGAVIARDSLPDQPASVYKVTFWGKIGDGVSQFLRQQPLSLGTPYLDVSVGETSPLLGPLLIPETGMELGVKLDSLLGAPTVDMLVDKGRKKGRVAVTDGDKTWTEEKPHDGPMRWFPDVAVELGQALTAKLQESLRRIVPRYIDAAVAIGMEEEARQAKSLIEVPKPTAGDIVPSAAIDRITIEKLVQHGTFNYGAFRSAHPDATGKKGTLRPVELDWDPPRNATLWARVKSPANPTVEEVANAMFGSPTEAGLIAVNASPLFGIGGGKQLLPRHRNRLIDLGFGAELDYVGDPIAEAKSGPLADEIAKNQAAGLRSDVVVKSDALRLIDENAAIIGKIEQIAARFGMGKNPAVPALTPIKTRLTSRRSTLASGDDAAAAGWGAQIQAQQTILSGVAFGFGNLVERLDAMTKKVEDATAKLGGFNLPSYVREAMNRVAMRYTDAALASEMAETGASLLATANSEARTLPIEFLEGTLASIQRTLDDARNSKRAGTDHHYGTDKMAEREQALRVRLATVRATLLTDPDAAGKELEALQKEILDLQTETEMVGNLDQIDEVWTQLEEARTSFWSSMGTSMRARINQTRGDVLHIQWKHIHTLWKSGDPKSQELAKQELEKLRGSAELHEYFSEMGAVMKAANRDQIIGKLVALLVITVVTAGIGEVFAAGAAGMGMGTMTAAGTVTLTTGGAIMVGAGEALIFTALSQVFLDDDHSLGHIAYEFGTNWLMFGTLRKFAAFAEAAKLPAVVKGGGQAVILGAMTLAKAEIDKYLATGKHLTGKEVGQIAVQAMVMYIAMHGISKFSEPLFKPLEGKAYAFGTKLSANNAALKALETSRAALAGKAEIGAAREYVADERTWLEQRSQVLGEIEVQAKAESTAKEPPKDGGILKKIGMDMDTLTGLKKVVNTALVKTKSNDVLLNMEPMAPDMFKVPRERVDAILPELGKVEKTTTSPEGVRTFEVRTPEGKLIKVTEKVDHKADLLTKLKAKATPDEVVRLEGLMKDATPKEALELNKALDHMTPGELEAFVKELGPEATRKLAARVGGAAMKRYGPQFFKNFKGVTANTMTHLLEPAAVVKGEIKGAHDKAAFLAELAGKGEVVGTPRPGPTPEVTIYEYKLYQKGPDGNIKQPPTLKTSKPEVKTVIDGLDANQAAWQQRGNEAVWDAIKNQSLRASGEGLFTGMSADGLTISGYVRGAEVHTFFVGYP